MCCRNCCGAKKHGSKQVVEKRALSSPVVGVFIGVVVFVEVTICVSQGRTMQSLGCFEVGGGATARRVIVKEGGRKV